MNDVAIAFPPGGAPILVASYMSDGLSALTVSEAAHAEIGRLVARELHGYTFGTTASTEKLTAALASGRELVSTVAD